ncbi:LuxR C-terminal-related transcriptional regulator [Kribbella qitaiheensis]|uniref:helix-turn-helix transcriptional regulator n=1 Tax=Kribbella qitaiheensis TaxID=1544730 RepID=UPI00361D0B64
MRAEGGRDDPLRAVRYAIPGPPRAYVERRRLTARLDRGAELPLTLVSAPAGSGKTALVASWATKRQAPGGTAWITFEERDASAKSFWSHVHESLRRLGVVLPVARYDTPRAHSRMLTRLADALAGQTHPLTLVLDGYELATTEESSDIDFLLRHSGQRLRVVLLTRVDPVLPLHRYRLAEMMTEVRMADLAFTEEETSRLVRQSGINLSATSISAVARRTRGWAAGLRFASMFLESSGNPDQAVDQLVGDTGNIAEYLMAEILQTQPAPVRALLLRTSIVDVLQPGLIDELGGRSAARTLASLARGNMLVEALTDHPGWYRYHPFLRDLLRAELVHRSPTGLVRLHKQAAQWYARHGFLRCAVGMAAAVEAWSDASAYVIDDLAIGKVLLGNDPDGLNDDLRKMPRDIRDPAASVVRAALALADHKTDRCAEALGSIGETAAPESAHSRAVKLSAAIVRTVRSGLLNDPETVTHADLAQHELSRLEHERVIAHPELTALVQASNGKALLRGGEIGAARAALASAARVQAPGCEALTVSCLGYLALIESHQGQLRRAHDWASQSASVAQQTGLPSVGWPSAAEIALAQVSTERYDLRASREHLRAALRSYDVSDDPVVQASSAIVQARLLRARGEVDQAIALLETIDTRSEGNADWPCGLLLLELAMLKVVQGEPEVAVRMIDQPNGWDEATRSLVLGHAQVELEDWVGVEKSVSAILDHGGQEETSLQSLVGGRLLEVAYELHRHQPGRARVALNRALRLAEPEDLRRPFREAPAAVRRFLETDTTPSDRNALIGSEVESGPKALTRRSVPAGRSTDEVRYESHIEPLTAKELEVLGHLSELLTTEEIATVMFISVNTVRSHVRSILRKLAVSRRNDAVRRARDLSLVPG